ncbi:hypothetical protein ABZ590_15505 [Streptomyces hirsutus]|uniref:thiolase family protein n=1 Tax=Streptomyces hirsutus TaxID=35620 RepID=UPI0033F0DF84
MGEEKIVIVDGARTPVGSFGGVFKDVSAHELGATATSAALDREGEPLRRRDPTRPPGRRHRRAPLAAGSPRTWSAATWRPAS